MQDVCEPKPIPSTVSPGQWAAMGLGLTLFLTGLGAGVLAFGPAMAAGNELTLDRAIFHAASAVTQTGMPLSPGVGEMQPMGVATMASLAALGAWITLTVSGVLLVRLVSPYRSVGEIATGVLGTSMFLVFIGATALMALPEQTIGNAIVTSLGAFTGTGLFQGGGVAPNEWQNTLILTPLALAGAIGAPLLLDLKDLTINHRPVSTFTLRLLGINAVFYVALLAILVTVEWIQGGSMSGEKLVALSSLSSWGRTGGGMVGEVHAMGRGTQFILMLAMAVGVSPGGLGGGLRLPGLLMMGSGLRRMRRGKTVGPNFARMAYWVLGFAAIAGLCSLAILGLERRLPFERVVFESISAASNNGLSFDVVLTTGAGLLILAATMVAGHAGTWFVLSGATRDEEELPPG